MRKLFKMKITTFDKYGGKYVQEALSHHEQHQKSDNIN